jgi:GNAT superfamily N-acetyltransferase
MAILPKSLVIAIAGTIERGLFDDRWLFVADTERGKGLAGTMFKTLQKHKNAVPRRCFVKADNEMLLRAHDKMGMERLGTFINDAVIAFRFTA